MSIRVLVIDDSDVMRAILSEVINREADMEVVGQSDDPLVAREQIKALDPDVITLDIEMPRMDGITFLEKLMRLRPTPVIMISALTASNAEVTLRALELGAVDYVTKPGTPDATDLQTFASEIVEKIRLGAPLRQRMANQRPARNPSPDKAEKIMRPLAKPGRDVICIGASTGGIEAVKQILMQLTVASPPALIVQHLPEVYTRAFADRMDKLCAITVREAHGNELLAHGQAYIAPGHSHLRLAQTDRGYVTQLDRRPPINRHRPSVDALFHSAAEIAGARAIGVLLTGMGRDGAEGLLAMRERGAFTIAQDEASSVIFGMPRSAIELGAACIVLPLQAIASGIEAHTAK